MQSAFPNVSLVKEKARGDWDNILSHLGQGIHDALQRPGHHVPCPRHGGEDGFRVFRDVKEKGGGICNTCGAFPNGLDLLQFLNGWTFRDALEAVASTLSLLPDNPRPASPATPSRSVVKSKVKDGSTGALRRTWGNSVPLSHPLAEPARMYLAKRGLTLDDYPQVLRLHPALGYWEADSRAGTYPALLAVVHGPAGTPATLHRTYLDTEGRKAPVSSPKKLMKPSTPGAYKGGAIRLFPPGRVLVVAEGIETALAIHVATGLPVWSTVSAWGMQTLIVPIEVEEVIICADHDRSGVGQDAAWRLAERLLAEGRRVKVIIPPEPGTDFNDLLLEGPQ